MESRSREASLLWLAEGSGLPAAQGYMDLVITTQDQKPAPCKLHLLGKDGVYLMQIPRTVDDLVLATANRCVHALSPVGHGACNVTAPTGMPTAASECLFLDPPSLHSCRTPASIFEFTSGNMEFAHCAHRRAVCVRG